MGILWLSYGYPMVRVRLGLVFWRELGVLGAVKRLCFGAERKGSDNIRHNCQERKTAWRVGHQAGRGGNKIAG